MQELLRLPLLIFLIFCMGVIGGCGGDDDIASVPPVMPEGNISKGVLAQGVRVLSEGENALLRARQGDVIRYSGSIDLKPGEVVLGNELAFKVMASAVHGGETVITVADPAVDELFSSLLVRGDFTVETQQVQSSGRSTSAKARDDRENAFGISAKTAVNWTQGVVAGSTAVTTTTTGNLTAMVDYDFDIARGGLQSGTLGVQSTLGIRSAVDLKAGNSAPIEKLVYQARIPVNVNIVDFFLKFVGVRVVSVYIPFYLGAEASSEFEMSFVRTTSLAGNVRIDYTNDGGAILKANYGGENGDSEPRPTTDDLISGTYTEALKVYLLMKPSIAFLDTVALAGVAARFSAAGTGKLKTAETEPGYCLSAVPSLDVSANGFFKGVGFKTLESNSYSKNIYTGKELTYGACQASPTVSIDIFVDRLGLPIELSATVSVPPGTPDTVERPTGKLTFEDSEGRTLCEAEISASGSATCPGTIYGIPITLTAKYGGGGSWLAASSAVFIDRIPQHYKN